MARKMKDVYEEDSIEAMERELLLEKKREERALRRLTKASEKDFAPFLEDEKYTAYQSIDDINGSFNGRW